MELCADLTTVWRVGANWRRTIAAMVCVCCEQRHYTLPLGRVGMAVESFTLSVTPDRFQALVVLKMTSMRSSILSLACLMWPCTLVLTIREFQDRGRTVRHAKLPRETLGSIRLVQFTSCTRPVWHIGGLLSGKGASTESAILSFALCNGHR